VPSDKIARLLALEARLPPSKPVINGADLRKRLELMAYLAARRPHESACEAITRMLGLSPSATLTADFAHRWDALLRPLRGLEGQAFAEACEEIRGRHL
jgi:hypothetical protein